MRLLSAAALAVCLVPGLAQAQGPSRVPQAFLGNWVSLGLNPGPPPMGAPPTELPYAEIDKRLEEFLQPWAVAARESLEWNIDDTGQVCKFTGIFRQGHGTGAGNFRFVETPGKLYQVWSPDQRGLQRIYLDSPHPPSLAPTWNGDSRGRFVGETTLIVDTVAFNDKSWLNSDRWIHTEELHVVERYRVFGGGAYIQLRVFVDDRRALKAPYTYTRYYTKMPDPVQGGENVCNQNLPEDDLWAERRNELLAEHEAKLAAFMAKYDNEPLPQGPGPSPPATAAVPAPSATDAGRLRALGGIYEPVPEGTALPGGVAARGALADLPLVPAALALAKTKNLALDPARHCMVVGPFRMMARPDNRFEVLTTPNRVTLMFQNIALGHKREIYLGRTQHPVKLEPSFLGDSIGRWEGDTFVVDTAGFNDLTWLNDAGAPHSDALTLVERFRLLPGGRYLEYQVTARDPMTLTKPFAYTRYYQRSTNELLEYSCESRVAGGGLTR